jgi:hypothetical protein
MSRGSECCLPTWEDSSTVTCPTVFNHVSLFGRGSGAAMCLAAGDRIRRRETRGSAGALSNRGRIQSHGIRDSTRALSSREAGSRAAGHVAVPEPFQTGRRDPELLDTWQRQSPLEQGGRIQSHETHGSARTLPSWEARSGTIGHVAVHLPYLGLKHVCGGT